MTAVSGICMKIPMYTLYVLWVIRCRVKHCLKALMLDFYWHVDNIGKSATMLSLVTRQFLSKIQNRETIMTICKHSFKGTYENISKPNISVFGKSKIRVIFWSSAFWLKLHFYWNKIRDLFKVKLYTIRYVCC